jgi:hypothetical protein
MLEEWKNETIRQWKNGRMGENPVIL